MAKKLGWEAYCEIPSNLSIDVILNSIGTVNWDQQIHRLKEYGRMVIISAVPNYRETQINLFDLYRKNQEIIGINTLDLDHAFNAKLLNEMREGFESHALVPLEPGVVFPLEEASKAYRMVIQGSHGKRVVLQIATQKEF